MVDDIGQVAESRLQGAAAAVEEVDAIITIPFVAGPTRHGDLFTIRGYRHRLKPAFLLITKRRAQHLQQLAAAQIPHPGGFIMRGTYHKTFGSVHIDTPD